MVNIWVRVDDLYFNIIAFGKLGDCARRCPFVIGIGSQAKSLHINSNTLPRILIYDKPLVHISTVYDNRAVTKFHCFMMPNI